MTTARTGRTAHSGLRKSARVRPRTLRAAAGVLPRLGGATSPQLPGLSQPRRRPLLLQATRPPHHVGGGPGPDRPDIQTACHSLACCGGGARWGMWGDWTSRSDRSTSSGSSHAIAGAVSWVSLWRAGRRRGLLRVRSVAGCRRRCSRRSCPAWCAGRGSWRRGFRGWCVRRWV